jgi:DNA helicase-2/ATP-dependent DNA helicase PcrA
VGSFPLHEQRMSRNLSYLSTTPLRQFLQASMLSSEGDNQSEEGNKDVCLFIPFVCTFDYPLFWQKVTISTCHSAKGLEWPVVMIPSGKNLCGLSLSILIRTIVDQNTFPFYRSEDTEEERYKTFKSLNHCF